MTLKTVPMKLLVIVAEAFLRERLMTELKTLGVSGCTAATVTGWGHDAVRASEWENPSVRLETIVAPELADAVLELLAAKYFPQGSVVAWLSDVAVVRAEKFATSTSPASR